jgi:hypothetical protein
MTRVAVVGGDLFELRDRVLAAERLLTERCARIGERTKLDLGKVVIIDVRAEPIVIRRRTLFLGREYLRRSPPQAIALVLVYAATAIRLYPYIRRRASADRLAQYWRRIAREVVDVARVLDHGDDPAGYVMGVSSGHWEEWARSWLDRAVLATPSTKRTIRAAVRDMRRLGVPKWGRRVLAAVRAWRAAPYNER